MKTFKEYTILDEAVGKFMTGEVGIKGKRVKVEVEVSGVDNKKRIYHAKVLAPKEHFGLELQIPAKVMHRGKWIKTNTGKAFEEANSKYIVSINPNDKKWYAMGHVGRNKWMPVSNGFKNKAQAQKWAKSQDKVDIAARGEISGA
jgi:hypothetical protein